MGERAWSSRERAAAARLPALIFRLRGSSFRRAVTVPGLRVHGAGSSSDDAGPVSESNLILQREERERHVILLESVKGPKKACQ